MAIRFSGVVRAGTIAPDVVPRFLYTAGEAISSKELICKGESDGKVYKAKADDSARMPCIAVAVTSASEDGKTIYGSNPALITNITRTEDFGNDDPIYVSETAGKASKNVPANVGSFVQLIGRSINSSDVMVNVDQAMIRLDQV